MKPDRARSLVCALLPAALALGYVACSSRNSDLPSTDVTNVYVDPSFLQGEVICGPFEGAMQTYVVTLVDETGGARTALPSSPPTSCNQLVGFNDQLVVPDHVYSAAIDVYDLPACDAVASPELRPCLVPYGGLYTEDGAYRSGERAMARIDPGDPYTPDDVANWRPLRAAQPAWQPLSCEPVTARLLASTRLSRCAPTLVARRNENGQREGGLALSLDALRGPLPCAPADGTSVGRVEITYAGVTSTGGQGTAGAGGAPGSAGSAGSNGVAEPSAEPRSSACAPGAEIRYEKLTAGATYAFRVSAFDGAGVLHWATSCEGTPLAGIGNRPMACDLLSSEATLRVPFATLEAAHLARFGAVAPPCAAADAPGLASVDVALGGQGPLQPTSCGRDLSFDGLTAGTYTLRGAFNVRAAGDALEARPFFCEGYALPSTGGPASGPGADAVSCQFL